MSVQNKINKPSFTKSVMGYTQSEVDKYVDRVIERYNSVCRENAELKRRVLALSLRIEEAESKLEKAEKESENEKILTKSSLLRVFDMLNDEKKRYSCFIDSLMETLNTMASEEDFRENDDDWVSILDDYIEEAILEEEQDEKSKDASSDDGVKEDMLISEALGYIKDRGIITSAVAEEAHDPVPDVTPADVKEQSEAIAEETEAAQTPEKTESDLPEAENRKKTPAEIAAELDFYPDKLHADGESFDPMILAAQATSQRKRPIFADLMDPRQSDEK